MSPQMSRTRNSALNVITGVGGQMLMILLKFVTRTFFISTLGKSYLGINGLFSDILTMLSLTELGFDTAINFQMYKPLAEGDNKRVRVLMKFYKQAYRVVGATIFCLGLCLIPLLPILIRDYDSLAPLGIDATLIFLLYLLQSVSSYLFFAYRSAVMKANQQQYVLDIADFGITILTNVVQILVLVFMKDFVIYTAIIIVFNIITNFVNASIATRRYPQFFEPEEDSITRAEVFGLLKDCGALFVYRLNGVVLKATDNLVLSTFVGLATVGMYSNYLMFYTAIRSLLNKVYNAVKASMGNLFATGDMARRYKFFQVMNYLTILLYGTSGVGIAVCSNELISVWIGDDYIVSQPLSILIGVEILFYGLKMNLGQIRNVSGAFRQMWFRPILGVIINIVVSITLVRIIGIYGVVVGTISADLLTNFLVDPSVLHKYSFENYRPVSEYYRKNLLYIGVLSLVCALDIVVCGIVFTGHGWISVIFHMLVVVTTVFGACIGLFWNSDECRYLWNLTTRVINKVFGKKGRS